MDFPEYDLTGREDKIWQMIKLEVWLYGPMAKYVHGENAGSYAQLQLELAEGTTMRDLIEQLGIPPEKKGITFINAQLTDMPGLGADLERELQDGDRIGFFHERSMWPFQYRFGASTSPELGKAMQRQGFLRHSSATPDQETEPTTD
jgi:putative ubiquitin-RnfH superfamily antitoxin RatB of RatAB toxin-antitoxin module